MDEIKFNINSLRVAAPCHVTWDSMNGDDRVRHCDSCNLKVFNIAAMTEVQARKLVTTRTGRLCVKLYKRADGTVITSDCPVGLRAYRKKVGRLAGAVLTTVLGLFSISFGQNSAEKPVDASKAKIGRTVDRSKSNHLSGQVLDPMGAVVPGAQLILSRSDEKRTERSRDEGDYSFSEIPSGTWNLSVKSPGFKEFRLNKLVIGSNEQIVFNTVLSPNSEYVTVGILVDEDRPLIDTTSSSVTTVITNRQMESIPHED